MGHEFDFYILSFIWALKYYSNVTNLVITTCNILSWLIDCIVKEGNYYANSKKFVLPSSLFMLELRAGCHSQLKMVSEVMANILAFVDHLCWLFTNFSSKKLHSKTASFYAYAIIFYAAVFSVRKNFTLIFFWLGNFYASSFPQLKLGNCDSKIV